MNKLWEYVGKFKKHGLKESLTIIWERKIDVLIRKIILFFVKNKPLKNKIIIASHNDFDTNGGVFYEYLIEHGYNKQYKIVWLCRNPKYMQKKLPNNVVCYSWFTPNWQRDMDICTAKYFLADDWIQEKVRSEQMSIYCTHGAGILKNVKGKIVIPDSVDYILAPSENFAEVFAYQLSVKNFAKRLVYLGYPVNDILYKNDLSEINKLTDKYYSKVVIWMPTFRKGNAGERLDGYKEQKMGVPLIDNYTDYKALNYLLNKNKMLLIIKIHPMQDLENLKIYNCSNIIVLTADDVKKKNIDNYRLLCCTDALISDYSSIAAEYFHLDKPIAYCLDDINEYKIGFVMDDITKLMPGNKIYKFGDMVDFLKMISDGLDHYKRERHEIFDWLFKYHDGKSCYRLANFMGLEISKVKQ